MNKPDPRVKALELFRGGYNCAQSVFAAFAPGLGVDEKTALSAASGFGAGMGLLQKTCGAVTGAILVLGCSRFDAADVAGSKAAVYERVRALVDRFERRHGSVECMGLLETDIRTPEGLAAAREKGLFQLKCEAYVLDACGFVEDIPGKSRKEPG